MLLETAPDGTVLGGTVRGRVIAAAHMCGISVRYTAPDPRERDTWREAFVCNALRLLQPVQHIVCPSSVLPLAHACTHSEALALHGFSYISWYPSMVFEDMQVIWSHLAVFPAVILCTCAARLRSHDTSIRGQHLYPSVVQPALSSSLVKLDCY